MLAMYLLRLYIGEPLYETIGPIGTPGWCIFAWPWIKKSLKSYDNK